MKFPHFLRAFLIAARRILLLLLIGIPLALLFLRNVDFEEMIKRRIETSLSRESFKVHIGHLSFHFFQGLTAENVVLNPIQENKPPIGNIRYITFSMDILGYFFRHPLIKQVRIYDASLNIPLSEDASPVLPIRNAHAEILLKPNCVEISNTTFTFENIRFSVNGVILNPQMFKAHLQQSSEQKQLYLQRLGRFLEELEKIKYLKEPAQVKIVFKGDLSKPEILQAPIITLQAENIAYHGISLQQLELRASYAQGRLKVQQVYLRPSQGELVASGTADLNASKGYLIFNSSLDPTPFLTEFISDPRIRNLKNLHMESPPQMEFNGDVSWGDGNYQCKGTGSAVLRSFSYKKLSFSRLELKFSAENERVEVQQLYLRDSKGELTASGAADLNTSKGQFTLHSSLNPVPILQEFISNSRIQNLQNLHMESPPQMEFNGDVSWADGNYQCKGTGSAALWSFSYKKLPFSLLELKFSAENGRVEVQQLHLRDSKGELTASGTADLSTSKSQFTLSSSLNLVPILQEFISDSRIQYLQDLHMESSPSIDFTGEVSWGKRKYQYKGTGAVALRSFSYKKLFFPQLEFKFSAENDRSFIQDLRLQTRSGILRGNLLIAPNYFQVYADSTLNPKAFRNFFDPATRKFFDHTEIVDSPHITLRLHGPKLDFASLSGRGKLTLGRTAVRGAWIDFARSKIEIANQAVTIRDFVLGRGTGRGSGTFTYDFRKKQVLLKNIISTMIPRDVMLWIDPHIAQTISVYKFHESPNIQADGLVHLKNPNFNALSIYINSEAGLDYNLLKRTLRFGQTYAEVHVDGPWVKVHIPSSKIFQGSAALSANVSIDPKNPTFRVDLSTSHVDFASLTKLYFDYDDSKGFLSGNFGFRARLGKEEDMTGGGSIRIEGSNVLSVPFLGPISIILNGIIPGAGYKPSKKAIANFQVENRKVLTKDLQIMGPGFILLGSGDVEFLTGRMDMTVRINARSFPGLLFLPITRLLEYESRGTLRKPEWHVKPLFRRTPL